MADIYTTCSHNWKWVRNTLAFNWNHTANASRNVSFLVSPCELQAMQIPVYYYEDTYTLLNDHI